MLYVSIHSHNYKLPLAVKYLEVALRAELVEHQHPLLLPGPDLHGQVHVVRALIAHHPDKTITACECHYLLFYAKS